MIIMKEEYIILIIYLLLINIWGYLITFHDKRRAVYAERRVPEKTFWVTALLGGAAGIYLGMKAFRHKTKKRLFSCGMPVLIILTIAAIFFLTIQ